MTPNNMRNINGSFSSFDQSYDILTNGKGVSHFMYILDRDGIWKRLELLWMMDYFEDREEYEKCMVLKSLMMDHFIGEDSVQNQLNEMLWNNRLVKG